jgi:hypothetical protein
VFFTLAKPFRRAIASASVKNFSKVKAIVSANYFNRFYAGVFFDAKKFLIALIIGGKPA